MRVGGLPQALAVGGTTSCPGGAHTPGRPLLPAPRRPGCDVLAGVLGAPCMNASPSPGVTTLEAGARFVARRPLRRSCPGRRPLAGRAGGACRRCVAATTTALTCRAPPTRRARAASTRVAPVVRTSSTSRQQRPATAGRHRGVTCIAPSRLAARWRESSPAWSATRRRRARAGATHIAAPRALLSGSAASTRSRSGASPRRRTAAAGGRHRHHQQRLVAGRQDGARHAGRTGRPRPVPRSSSGASTPHRSRRPSSLYATSAARTGPSYGVVARTVGRPAGQGVGATSRGPPANAVRRARAAQPRHHPTPSLPQPAARRRQGQLRGGGRCRPPQQAHEAAGPGRPDAGPGPCP